LQSQKRAQNFVDSVKSDLSTQVPDYCRSLDEQTVCKQAFELIFAFDEVVAMGYKEKVTVQQVKQFVEMDSQEEKIFEMIQRVSVLGTF
jgi:hypothetical protein